MNEVEVTVESNLDSAINELEAAKMRILEKIGLRCERYAKEICPVDTGRLRNSITHAISGGSAAIRSYHASHEKSGTVGFGVYSGTIGSKGEDAVYIGTNVEYAMAVELGSSRNKNPRPYLKPAVVDHIDEYKAIAKNEL